MDAPKGNLGDLDKSYIWYYGKAITGGPLGLAQASPNPRSGIVENMNALMYGGNILSYVANEQRVAKALKAYEQRKAKVFESLVAAEKAKQDEAKAQAAQAQAEIQALIEEAGMGTPPAAVSTENLASPMAIQKTIKAVQKTKLTNAKSSGAFTNKNKLSQVNLGDKAFLKNIFENLNVVA